MRALASLLLLLASLTAACSGPAPIQISVFPANECVLTGPQGGPFSTSGCSYQVTANRSAANFTTSGKPDWLVNIKTGSRTPATITYGVGVNAARLAPGEYRATITFQNTTQPQAPVARSIKLVVSAPIPPPPPGSWTININAAPAHYANVGDTTQWQYVLSNTGTVSITGIAVSSSKGQPSCPWTQLDPGQLMMCSNQSTATQADITAGTISNTVTAGATNAPTIQMTGSVNYVPPSQLTEYLLDDAGGKLCEDTTCTAFLLAR